MYFILNIHIGSSNIHGYHIFFIRIITLLYIVPLPGSIVYSVYNPFLPYNIPSVGEIKLSVISLQPDDIQGGGKAFFYRKSTTGLIKTKKTIWMV